MSPLTAAADPLAADRDHVLARTEQVWADLRGARVLITGGTGFVGCWLLESLRWANERLGAGVDAVVLTRDPGGFARRRPHLATGRGIRLEAGDVRGIELAGEGFTHVVHGAASADAALYAREPLAMLDTIVEGTRRTLECASRQSGAGVLLISSGAVYGRQPPELANIPEDYAGAPDPLDAAQVYAEGKRTAEVIGAVYRDAGLQIKVARLFAFVGPYLPLDRHFAVGNFIRDRLSGGPVAIAGDGTPFRSYLYGADLAIWLWAILLRGASGRAYNVGSARAVSIAEVARTVAETLPPAVAVTRARTPDPNVPAERYVPDTSRGRSELGLEEWIGLEEGVRRTLRWAGLP